MPRQAAAALGLAAPVEGEPFDWKLEQEHVPGCPAARKLTAFQSAPLELDVQEAELSAADPLLPVVAAIEKPASLDQRNEAALIRSAATPLYLSHCAFRN